MKPPAPDSTGDAAGDSAESLRKTAAHWVVCRDRGFTASEAAEFERWLAADPRHAAAIARASGAWSLLGRIPAHVAEPIAAASRPRTLRFWPVLGGLGLAAAVAVIFSISRGPWTADPASSLASDRSTANIAAPADVPQTRMLPDGTLVRLNAGAVIAEDFTANERSVRLQRGEAFFTVMKDSTRPFVVYAIDVTVRAVGTAFNVNLQDRAVDVLVTEGLVQVNHRASDAATRGADADAAAASDGVAARPTRTSPLVRAGQRAVVPLVSISANVLAPEVEVSEVDAAMVARMLAWREPLVNLGGATLAELAVQFERHTGRRMVLVHPELASIRVGGRFPSDDLESFVRVLEEHYGVVSRRDADGTLLLEKSP